MKHTCRMTLFFLDRWKRLLLLGPALAAVQLLYSYAVSATPANAFVPFEAAAQRAVFPLLYVLLMFVLLGCTLYSLCTVFRGRPCMGYTLLTLPIPRTALPLGALCALLLEIAALTVCQVLSLLGCARIWAGHAALAAKAAGSSLPAPHRANDLFLAMLRCPLGRLLLPPTFTGVLALLLMGLTIALFVVHAANYPRGLASFAPITGEAFVLVLLLLFTAANATFLDGVPAKTGGLTLLLLAAADAALLCHTIHRYRTASLLP